MPIRIFNLRFDPARGVISGAASKIILLNRNLYETNKQFCEGNTS